MTTSPSPNDTMTPSAAHREVRLRVARDQCHSVGANAELLLWQRVPIHRKAAAVVVNLAEIVCKP